MNTVRGRTSPGLLDLSLGRWLDEETGGIATAGRGYWTVGYPVLPLPAAGMRRAFTLSAGLGAAGPP